MGEFPGPIMIIARDNFVDEVQLAQVAADGATAVILPLLLNGEEQTGALMAAAAELGLDTLVSVGDEAEVEAAVRLGASCVCFGDSGARRADELRQLLPEGVICSHPAAIRSHPALAPPGCTLAPDAAHGATNTHPARRPPASACTCTSSPTPRLPPPPTCPHLRPPPTTSARGYLPGGERR